MAVVNRAMAWSYIQMTKAELDYYTYLWLERVRDSFKNDSEKCLKVNKDKLFLEYFGREHKAGWWHSKYTLEADALKPVFIPSPFELGAVYTLGLDCHAHFHDNPDNREIRWIGLGPGDEEYNRIRIGYTSGGQLEYRDGDLYIPGDSSQGLVSSMQESFGPHGANLKETIDGYQKDIACCNGLLTGILEKMTNSIPETVRRTLLENLPRTASGEIDESILDQYRWGTIGGISGPPPDYMADDEAGEGEESADPYAISARSFFSGARNVEEDELRFLNMADGLPQVQTGPGGTVTLKDYFADPDSALSAVRDMAGGLDQWFIRCRREEMANSTDLAVDRTAQYAIPGIVRNYKNANYDEGRSTGSVLGGVAGKFNVDVHRGNHVAPQPDVSAKFSGWKFPGFSPGLPSKPKIPKHHWPKSWRKLVKRTSRPLMDRAWGWISGLFNQAISNTFGSFLSIINNVLANYVSLDIDPSCINEQSAFPDQCSNVDPTRGLVADYEWKAAGWLCGWVKRNGSRICCWHIPLPVGLMFGSASDSTYGRGLFSWFSDEIENFTKKGHSREKYRNTFIGVDMAGLLDGKQPFGCQGVNQVLRGYTRIYGDDKDLMQYSIRDKMPARPWFLNPRFFEGQGSIIVAIAKEQRNVFDWLADAVTSDKSVHSAFTPVLENEKDATPYYVAISAGRAGPARRTGDGRADGTDTENANLQVPAYEVAWDTVTDRTFDPQLAKGDDDVRAGLVRAFAKEGYSLEVLEREHRWGCACGESDVDARLRRQWNLSQADWDGMLIPLRHALSGTAETNDTVSATTDRPVWDWNDPNAGADEDDALNGVDGVVRALYGMKWQRFDRDGITSDKTSDLIGPAFNLPLFRTRRIL
ncbi:MAG: hypothetical protein IJ783_09705 [Kiritimatiellae bacterium]|nr:hypothetical protein [Kiritimatiellia bacterium]